MASQFSSIDLSERVELDELKKSFKRNGYFRLDNLLTSEEIESVRSHLKEYQDKIVPTIPNRFAFYENKADETTLIRLERMLRFSDYFKELGGGVFKDLAELLIEEKCEVNNVAYFSKPPGAKPTPPHQDGQYFMHSKGMTLWLALDSADNENGCLRYVPGSHHLGLLPHSKTNTLGFSQGLVEYTDEFVTQEETQEVGPGTLLGHHPLTVHLAGENRSKRWRPALGLTYWALSCYDDKEWLDKYSSYNDKVTKDLTDEGRI